MRGFEEDLGLVGNQFATTLSILYVGYIAMQVPSYVSRSRSRSDLLLTSVLQWGRNMFLNRIGKPSIYLPVCMALWGLISTLTGVTHNFVGVVFARFFLGICESAFFPVRRHCKTFFTCSRVLMEWQGALFLLSKWYKRSELGLRAAVLACGSLVSSAFGSLIASGILDGMEGVLGHAAWRWYVILFFRSRVDVT